MRIVLLSSDLLLLSIAQNAAERHGASLDVAPSADVAVELCAASDVGLLVIDLRERALAVERLVEQAHAGRPAGIWIMACAPHVHESSLALASQAGCDEVVTRGQFERQVNTTIQRLAQGTAGPGGATG